MTLTDMPVAALQQLSKDTCPDCGHVGFILGPRGGLALNIECGGCKARFNITRYPKSDYIVWAQRIEKESEGGAVWPVGGQWG